MTDGESDQEREERNERIIAAAVKVVAVAVAIGVAIGIGTWVMVKSLGLDDANTSAIGPAPVTPIHPLPTKALPQPHESSSPADGSSGNPSNYPTEIVTPSPGNGDLFLNAAPVQVKPMERINLTGQWPGHDNVSLLVQRLESGAWVDFGVQVQVQVGTFATYVMTGRQGDNKFRVFDPETNTTSNDVTVTIGG